MTFQNGVIVTFSTLLVCGLGFAPRTSILLQIPNGVWAALFGMGFVIIAHRIESNTLMAVITATVSLLNCMLLAVIPGTPKLSGLYLSWATTGTGALALTLVTNDVSGYTKKVFYNVIFIVDQNLGNFVGPLVIVQEQAPTY